MTEKQIQEYHNRVVSFIRDCGTRIVWVPDPDRSKHRILILNEYRGYVVPAEMAVHLPAGCSKIVHGWGYYFSSDSCTSSEVEPMTERVELMWNDTKRKMVLFQLKEGERHVLRYCPKLRKDWIRPVSKYTKHWIATPREFMIAYGRDMEPLALFVSLRTTPILP